MNTSEVLDKAADVIQRYGWHQGDYSPPPDTDGVELQGRPVCAVGAISVAAEESVVWSAACAAWLAIPKRVVMDATKALDEHLDAFTPGWNDAEGRTAAEVIEVLRATAVIEAARESEHAEVSA